MSIDRIQPISFPGDFEKLTEFRKRIERDIAERFQIPWGLLRERKRDYTANIVGLMQLEFYSELVRRLSNCKFPAANFIPKWFFHIN